MSERKDFPEWAVDKIYIEQDGVCTNTKEGVVCNNPLVNGFHRHHKDGDSSNNSPDNLQLLCLECHFATFKEPNPLDDHRKLQNEMGEQIGKLLEMVLTGGKMTGSTFKEVMGGIHTKLGLSWKQIKPYIEYPSPTLTMLRDMQKNKIVQDALVEGYKEGIKIGIQIRKDTDE